MMQKLRRTTAFLNHTSRLALAPGFRTRNPGRGFSSSSSSRRRRIPYIENNWAESSGIPKEKVDCVVIGAGVVGISISRELSLMGRQVLVLDSANTFGTSTSSRNSQVIHAGIYYPRNSFKAMLCIRGRELMYKYCSERNVPHKQTGKLIVATRESEIPKLNAILARGIENGVKGLRLMEPSEAMGMEPELFCVKALFSPVTGIVDSHTLMLSLEGDAENNGATFSYNTTVLGGQLQGNQIALAVTDTHKLENSNEEDHSETDLILLPKLVINSTGLSAITLAKRLIGLNNSFIPDSYYARGHYFSVSQTKKSPFTRLIYPLPEDGGIGVHVTLDLDGQVKFGPDVEWIGSIPDIPTFLDKFEYVGIITTEKEERKGTSLSELQKVVAISFPTEYSVNPERGERFYGEIRRYYPNLKEGSLVPGYSGIRPKICGPGMTPADFLIQGEVVHGVPGLVNLFGIESPGLTSSMAIAEHVASRLVQSI